MTTHGHILTGKKVKELTPFKTKETLLDNNRNYLLINKNKIILLYTDEYDPAFMGKWDVEQEDLNIILNTSPRKTPSRVLNFM